MNPPRSIFVALVVLIAAFLAVGLFRALSTSQPGVACEDAPPQHSLPPAEFLVTAEDYLAQGDFEYDQANCDAAIANYTRAIEMDPNFAEAYNNRAYVHMAERDYAAALPDLDQAIQLRPDYVNALMNRGDIYNYYYAIDHERAVADYDRVLKIDPNAGKHTSVCGHRLLALNHGWSLNVLASLLSQGVTAGCPQ